MTTSDPEDPFITTLRSIPREAKAIAELMGNDINMAIVWLLSQRDIGETEFAVRLNLSPNVVRERIHQLEMAGLVQNYLQRRVGTTETSFFTLTVWGRRYVSLTEIR